MIKKENLPRLPILSLIAFLLLHVSLESFQTFFPSVQGQIEFVSDFLKSISGLRVIVVPFSSKQQNLIILKQKNSKTKNNANIIFFSPSSPEKTKKKSIFDNFELSLNDFYFSPTPFSYSFFDEIIFIRHCFFQDRVLFCPVETVTKLFTSSFTKS